METEDKQINLKICMEIQSSMRVLLLYVEWSDKGSTIRKCLSIKPKKVREQAM